MTINRYALLTFLFSISVFANVSTPLTARAHGREDIIVHGIRRADVSNDVHQLIEVPPHHQISRWRDKLCPYISGFKSEYSAVILNHLQQESQRLNLPFSSHCSQNNIFIVVSNDSQGVVNKLIERSPDLWQGFNANPDMNTNSAYRNSSEINTLREIRPVRWFASASVEAAMGNYTTRNSAAGVGYPVLYAQGASFLISTTEEYTQIYFVIIDSNFIQGVHLGALADYVTTIILSRPDISANFSKLSIMSLFNNKTLNADAPSSMTDMDKLVLQALYTSDQAQDSNAEYDGIVSDVIRSLRN